MGRYINKAATKMGSQGVTAGLKIAADEKSSKNFKDMGKREKGIKLAVNKLTKEEQDFVDALNADIEQIDELSKATLGSYVKKATNQAFSKGYSGGAMMVRGDMNRDSEEEKAGEKNVHKAIKRVSGVTKATNKLTQEEQDFVDSLNNEIFEKADPYDIAGMIKKAKAKNDPNHPAMKHVAAIEDIKKHGGALSVQGDHVRSLIKALGEDANVDQIDELSKDAMLKYLSANKTDDTKAKETGDYDKMTKRMRGTDMAVRKYTAKPGSK